MTDLAALIVASARFRFGGNGYVADTAADVDMRLYVCRMAKLAVLARRGSTRILFEAFYDQDAACLMHAGFDHLREHGDISEGDRALMASIQSMEEWIFKLPEQPE